MAEHKAGSSLSHGQTITWDQNPNGGFRNNTWVCSCFRIHLPLLSQVKLTERWTPHQGCLYGAQGLNVCWWCTMKFPRCLRKPGPWYLAAEKTFLLYMQFHTSLHTSCDAPVRAVLCHRRNACALAEKFNWIFFMDYWLQISSYIREKLSYLLPSRANAAAWERPMLMQAQN